MNTTLRPGDLVEVRTPGEIIRTLDADGAVDHLPFMPEMLGSCGKRFRVSKRVVKTCSSGSRSSMRGFRTDDVVLLESVRCSGADHDGCQKACMIFWREAWLKKAEDATPPPTGDVDAYQRLRARLKTRTGPSTYFCQASELLKATDVLSKWDRILKCFSDVRAGNTSTVHVVRNIAIWLFWRIRRVFLGEYVRGRQKSTPRAGLGLHAGEQVVVKSMDGILETLNEGGYNRGLYFSPDMRLLCDTPQRVERKLEKIIVDGTGEMRELHHTVYLDGSMCGCAHVAFGGCSRCEFAYWREIWLRRHA